LNQSCRIFPRQSDGDLRFDLAHDLQGHFKVKFVFSNGIPFFWRQKWKERKILRSNMSLISDKNRIDQWLLMYSTKHLLTPFEHIRLISTRDGHTKPVLTAFDHMWPSVTTYDHWWQIVTNVQRFWLVPISYDRMYPTQPMFDQLWLYVTTCDHLWQIVTITAITVGLTVMNSKILSYNLCLRWFNFILF